MTDTAPRVGWRPLAVLVAGVCAVALAGVGAQSPDTARSLLDRGLALRGPETLPEAEALFGRAVDLAVREEAPVTEGHALRALAQVRIARGDAAGAAAYWTRAEVLFTAARDWHALGVLNNQRAFAAFADQSQDEAERGWLAALAAFEAADDAGEQGRALRNLTFLARLSVSDRIVLARQALDLVVASGDTRQEGLMRHQLSDLHYLDGDLAATAEYLEAAVPLLEGSGDQAALGRALTSQGRMHRLLGRPEDSVSLNRRAAMALESAGDLAGAAQALDAVTRALIELDDPGTVDAATAAVAVARRSGRPDPLALALCRLAVVLARVGRAPEALALLEEAAPLARSAALHDSYLDALAMTRVSLGDHAGALAARERRTPSRMPLEDRIWHSNNRAHTLLALGRPADAQAELRQAVSYFDELTAKLVPDDGSKRVYFERTRALVGLHVTVLAEVGEPEAALEASERGRARAFLDLMTARASNSSRTASPREARVIVPPSAAPVEERPVPVAAAPRALRLDDLLMRGAPERAPAAPEPRIGSAGSASVPSLAVMKGVAADLGSHLLSYWVERESTLIWVVAPDGQVTMARSAIGLDELARLASAAMATTTGQTRGAGQVAFAAGNRQALRRLHDVLIAPVRGALPETRGALLSIVPHGPLFRVSFAGLLDRRGRYLVEDFRLHYAPSIGTLAALPARHASDGPVLVVADPALDAGLDLPRLPAAAFEGRAIARELAPRAVELLAGRDATETRVRRAMPRASVVHFATHGVVSDTAPWTSYLALGHDAGGDDADGQLRAGELYALRLSADLVVLGACRTATGPLTGDGITGLARGFFAAGVPVVVASLWDLPDATTARMQPMFYRQWKTSGSAATALRNAQLELLRQLRAGRVTVDTAAGPLVVPEHPSVWAGLVVLGAP